MNIIYKLTKSVFIAACITLILSSMNFAQVANYTFTQTADTYTPDHWWNSTLERNI